MLHLASERSLSHRWQLHISRVSILKISCLGSCTRVDELEKTLLLCLLWANLCIAARTPTQLHCLQTHPNAYPGHEETWSEHEQCGAVEVQMGWANKM